MVVGMIAWPDDKRLRNDGRDGLRRFRETAAAAELEASAERWTVVAWPWTAEPPVRVVLQNASRIAISFSLGANDIWMLAEEPRDYHIRSAESLDRDARGLNSKGG